MAAAIFVPTTRASPDALVTSITRLAVTQILSIWVLYGRGKQITDFGFGLYICEAVTQSKSDWDSKARQRQRAKKIVTDNHVTGFPWQRIVDMVTGWYAGTETAIVAYYYVNRFGHRSLHTAPSGNRTAQRHLANGHEFPILDNLSQ